MKIYFTGICIALCCYSCSNQHYAISNIKGERHLITAPESSAIDPEMQKLVNTYKVNLDKEMSIVVGSSAEDMTYERPESLLTNLTSDVMLNFGEKYMKGDCDLAFMNVHGHRANLAKGDITVENLFEIYSFENTLFILKLKGSDLLDAFESYAKLGGAGVSSSVRLVIKDNKLVSATVNGKPVDKDKVYTIITLDYLADGNDGMEALKNATEVIDPKVVLRDMMTDYVKEQAAQGKAVTSKLDGRITIEK